MKHSDKQGMDGSPREGAALIPEKGRMDTGRL